MTESRKEREFRLREQEILETATELFKKNGLDNVTVADIAKATDIGKGTVYKHFVSKDVILARLGNDFSYDVLHKAQHIDENQSCAQQMREMFELCFKAYIEQPLMGEICQVYQQPRFLERLPTEEQTLCMNIELQYFEILNRIINVGKDNNELPDLPVDELIIGAYATYCGALEMLQMQQRKCFTDAPQLSQERFIDIIINYTMTGLFGRRFDVSNNK